MPSWDSRGAFSGHLKAVPSHIPGSCSVYRTKGTFHPPPPTPHYYVEDLTRPEAHVTCCLFDPTSSAPLLSMLQCAPSRPLPRCCLLLPSRPLLPLPLRPRQAWPQLLLPMLPLPLLQVLPQALWRVPDHRPLPTALQQPLLQHLLPTPATVRVQLPLHPSPGL
ncbi:hypothetical protein U0070_013932 [Myodes glareolus]|uniref:Uncharacterized protein n=1 Tax=Myodes glareolus TaxID=447135 RepID=A0AAW0I157_MYOGA